MRRRNHGCVGLAAVAALVGTPGGARPGAGDESIRASIRRAGDADDDATRLACLRDLRERPELDRALKADLERLVRQIERWVGGDRLAYFGGQVGRGRDYDFGIASGSPLYPLTYLYRGRMIAWYALESGGVWNAPERRRAFLDAARGFFERASKAFPGNRIARMYMGRAIPAPKAYEIVVGAPEWAVLEREGLERLTDIIVWWIDHRMREDGSYGGGWGDDCEMWRWWVPVLIGFDTPEISRAQVRFSEALLRQPHLRKGYMTRMTDVEHSAEDSSDAMTPMMHLDPENPRWRARALRLAHLMETVWTGRNERGLLQFKSTYFTVDRVDPDPRRACDTVYHPRAVQPALLCWQRTGDPRLTSLFSAWMDTWVDAAARSERGKPAGVLPTAIHWPDGKVGGLGPDWWDPRNHGEYTLYRYPSAMGLMLHMLLLTYHMTGDAKYLEPLRSMARIRLKVLETPPAGPPAPGTAAWCGQRMPGLASAVAKYRFLEGGTDFDALLDREDAPYVRFRLRGDREGLIRALRENVEALRINFEGYTSEVRYTDRVLRFPTLFGENGILSEPLPSIRRPNPALLYACVTGDPGDAGYFPLDAVRWLTVSRDIAALVAESGRDRFAAELFHFGPRPRAMAAELYLLAPGRYTFDVAAVGASGTMCLQKGEIAVQGPRTRIAFTLPSRRLCRLRVRRSGRPAAPRRSRSAP